MNGVNKVILLGNLGRDPEIHNFDNGRKKSSFSLATNESYKDRDGNWQTQTEWHNVVSFGNIADRVERRLRKGNTVYVEGKLRTRNWEDKDGNKRYTTEIYIDNFILIENNKREDGIESSYDIEESLSSTIAEASNPSDDLPF